MTVKINTNDADNDIDANLDIAGVETVTISVSTSTKAVELDVGGVSATTLVLTGGKAGEELDLANGGTTKLNKSVTKVDATGTAGHLIIDASATGAAAITMDVAASSSAHNLTGSGNADTFTIVGATGNAETVAGGAGADTLNITLDSTFTDGSGIAVETINVTIEAGEDVDTSGGGTGFNDAAVDYVNVTGGNSLSTFTLADIATGVVKVDASGFGGNLVASMGANDIFDSTVTIVGGALATDSVTAGYSAAATYAPKTTGIEILNITNASTNSPILSLANTSGVKTINVTNSQADTFKITGVTDQTVNVAAANNAAAVVEVVLAVATGTSDSVNITTTGTIGDGAKLDIDDVETVNIKVAGNASWDLSAIAMTTAGKTTSIVLSGAANFTVNDANAINADINVIDASAMTGSLNTKDSFNANSLTTTAMTIKGGSAADTIEGGTAADTLTGNGGADQFNMTPHANKFIYDTITDASNGDKLYITATAGTDATVQNSWGKVTLGSGAGFTDYLDECAKASTGGTNNVLKWFVYDGNTYVVSDNSNNTTFTAGTDDLICLAGVLDLSQSTVVTTNANNETTITLDVDGP
jgi:S-layer protein